MHHVSPPTSIVNLHAPDTHASYPTSHHLYVPPVLTFALPKPRLIAARHALVARPRSPGNRISCPGQQDTGLTSSSDEAGSLLPRKPWLSGVAPCGPPTPKTASVILEASPADSVIAGHLFLSRRVRPLHASWLDEVR